MAKPSKSTQRQRPAKAPAARRVPPIVIRVPVIVELVLDLSGGPLAMVRTAPAKQLSEGTSAPQRRAESNREIALAYFAALSRGQTAREAAKAARVRALELANRVVCDRTVRLLARLAVRHGGIENAPLPAFYDGRRRSRKAGLKRRAKAATGQHEPGNA